MDTDGKPVSIGFKYPNQSYKIRSLTKKEFTWKGDATNAGLFGQDKFPAGGHKYVAITEGEFDALSIYQTIRVPAVSVRSSSSALSDLATARSWINQHERIYFCFDSDAAGKDACHRCAKLFDYNKILCLDFAPLKDANDYLQAGKDDVLRNIWWNAKPYLPESIVSSFDEFDKILTTPAKQGIPYPFPTLTEMTYGLRTGESVLITAKEGIGKTEFMHAIEYGLLKNTEDRVGAIYLEEPKLRHLQALAGLELGLPVHLPGVTANDNISDALRTAVKEDHRLLLYSHFGSRDPEDLLDTIRFMVSARNVRWVLLDHISMAVSGLAAEADERRAIDYLSNRLELQVKELDYGLIMACHVNDNGDTRGSRMPGKIADIRIDLTRNTLADDPIARNTLGLSISKNRFSGKTGPAGELFFDQSTFSMSEIIHGESEIQGSSSIQGSDVDPSKAFWAQSSDKGTSPDGSRTLDLYSTTSTPTQENWKMEAQGRTMGQTQTPANDNVRSMERLLA